MRSPRNMVAIILQTICRNTQTIHCVSAMILFLNVSVMLIIFLYFIILHIRKETIFATSHLQFVLYLVYV
jgi:hypothetical protein